MLNSDKEIKLHKRFLTSYKKNTLAIFFSFVLTFMLLTTMLVLIHTNFKISHIQAQTEFTPSDCYVSDLSEQQLEKLRQDADVEWLGVQQGTYELFERNNQQLFLSKSDSQVMTMMAQITEGRLPESADEVVAEKWTLLNLGIEPVINQVIDVTDSETGLSKEFKLVGILSDVYGNKKYGLLNLYTTFVEKPAASYTAYLKFGERVDYESKVKALPAALQIDSRQIRECPAREKPQDLYVLDVEIISVILLISLVVFYGIYRIATLSRLPQYGILRAIGMKKKQLQKMILLELYEIYLVSVPVGISLGLIIAYFVMLLSGDRNIEVYLYNEIVRFQLVIPVWQLLICICITGILVGIIGYIVGKKITRPAVMAIITGNSPKEKEEKSYFNLQKSGSKTGVLLRMGCKYIFRDVKTSLFVILTICLGVTLFTALAYQANTMEIYRADTKEMYYLNGQYAMTMQYFDNVSQGVSRQSAGEIEKLDEVVALKTSSGLPIRVIDEDNVKRNDAYYNEHNDNLQSLYGYSDVGYDGKNQIYKSLLLGYNENALRALEPYVLAGDFQPENLAKNEVILCVFRMDEAKDNGVPGSYKEGTPLMHYQVGDEIPIKYRADLQTERDDYADLSDHGAEYIYRTYKVAAIVSFPYMYDCSKTIYPMLITSDRYIQEIAPNSSFQCMYLDGNRELSSPAQTDLERRLIQAGSENSNVSTRSLIAEIEQNEMFYHKQMVYIYGIAIIAFILVMINMVNNLCYRMQTRTREVCMLRAVGLSVAMAKKMIFWENIILGATAVIVAYFLSQPVLRYLYAISDMGVFGHNFHYAYLAFSLVSFGALLICALLSMRILEAWKTRYITQGMGDYQ